MPEFEEIQEHILDEDYSGWCTNCKEWTHDFCEPDARNYECPVCNKPTCFGAMELLFMLDT